MLGKDHINISIAFVVPFLISLIFLNVGGIVVFVVFMIAILIGSLLPDADCKGNATLFYRFPKIDRFMKKVIGRSIIWSFNHLITKKKIQTEHNVGDEHRGIMHSPVGVLFSSLMLIVPLVIFSFVFSLLDWAIILAIFGGLVIGQLLHLFEDSCTVSGINWLFPFKTKELKGKIYTFSKDPTKKDIRPKIYAGILYFLVLILILGFSFGKFEGVNILRVFLGILLYEIVALVIIALLSQSNSSRWIVKKETLKKIKKNLKSNFKKS